MWWLWSAVLVPLWREANWREGLGGEAKFFVFLNFWNRIFGTFAESDKIWQNAAVVASGGWAIVKRGWLEGGRIRARRGKVERQRQTTMWQTDRAAQIKIFPFCKLSSNFCIVFLFWSSLNIMTPPLSFNPFPPFLTSGEFPHCKSPTFCKESQNKVSVKEFSAFALFSSSN